MFTKTIASMKTAAEATVYEVANMTTIKCVKYQICLSDVKAEATTWRIADADCIVNIMERDNSAIMVNQQNQCKNALFIHLIEFEAW
jgi:hypothetical protein